MGQDVKKRYVREMIIDRSLDFIGLHDTIKSEHTINELHSLCGARIFGWFWCPPRGRSGGYLIGIMKKP